MITATEDVIDLCRDLIRIPSVNHGDGSGPGERAAAEFVAAALSDVGVEPRIVESAPGRASVLARIPGTDPSRPALLVHGHLDVVPADAADWTHDPFGAEVADDCIWGRGAVDMKDMDAMVLAVIRSRLRAERLPARDVVLAFTADEEAGGVYGAHWLVDNHPDAFEGATEAIGEVGGFSVTVNQRRIYLIESAQKGIAWLRLVAKGRAGHGSMTNDQNAVTELAAAVARIGRHEFPLHMTATTTALLETLADALGLPADDPDAIVARLGPLAILIGATLRNTANPTVLQAGYKQNVIPGEATALLDARFLPGFEDELLADLDRLLGERVRRETVHHDIAIEEPFTGGLVDAMTSALLAEDPTAAVAPYCLSGGTDLKAFSRLGISGFGFSPLRLPADLDFAGMFHGVDERVPIDSLQFGTRVLDRFLDLA